MSAGTRRQIFDMTGEKHAYIFAYDPPTPSNVEDTDLICSNLKGLGFQIMNYSSPPENNDDHDKSEDEDDALNSDEEQNKPNKQPAIKTKPKYNASIIRDLNTMDLTDFMKRISGKAKTEEAAKDGVSCILLYFVAPQKECHFEDADGKQLPLFKLWEIFKGVKCPKLFILQANVNENSKIHSVLLNSAPYNDDTNYFTLPESANVLLAYLPNSRNGQTSVAKILNEELSKPFEINTVMTTVIDRLKSQDPKTSPKFASTLIEQLYLKERLGEPMKIKLPVYTCRWNRCLMYSFLFGTFSEKQTEDLSSIAQADCKLLKDTFTNMGFELEFCAQNGCMTLSEFYAKLLEILEGKEKLESCDCIVIVISSHGGEHNILHGEKCPTFLTQDGSSSLNKVWNALSQCKELEGKPKVLAVDTCRGTSHELPVKYKMKSSSSKGQSKDPSKNPMDINFNTENCNMSDTVIAFASTEGMKAYGDEYYGSLFIRNLCETLNEYGKEDFLTILNATMHKVAHDCLQVEDDKTSPIPVKQQVTFTSTLRKLLHFPEKKDK